MATLKNKSNSVRFRTLSEQPKIRPQDTLHEIDVIHTGSNFADLLARYDNRETREKLDAVLRSNDDELKWFTHFQIGLLYDQITDVRKMTPRDRKALMSARAARLRQERERNAQNRAAKRGN